MLDKDDFENADVNEVSPTLVKLPNKDGALPDVGGNPLIPCVAGCVATIGNVAFDDDKVERSLPDVGFSAFDSELKGVGAFPDIGGNAALIVDDAGFASSVFDKLLNGVGAFPDIGGNDALLVSEDFFD